MRGEADTLVMARRERARAVKEDEGIVVIKRLKIEMKMRDEGEEWIAKR